MKELRGRHWFSDAGKVCCLSLFAVCLALLVSCGGGGGGSSSSSTGTVSVGLSDASTTDYKAIYVTVQQVSVHKDGEGDDQWRVISTPNKTYNLLALVNGVREDLAIATLPTGHYTQMRLLLKDTPDGSFNILSRTHPYGNYFIDNADNIQELKIPSGLQTGIKIVKGFDINSNETTELLLDFDAAHSIVKAGSSGKWLLKPTIQLMAVTEYGIIQGSAGQSDVLVSAQVYTAPSTVTVQGATVSDATGGYKLFVAPGTYTVVAYKQGYNAASQPASVTTPGAVYALAPFTLTLAPSSGTLTGTVAIADGDQEQYATISIRQSVNNQQIEITSFNVADSGTFSVSLPAGDYFAFSSTAGHVSQETTFNIAGNGTATVDITF